MSLMFDKADDTKLYRFGEEIIENSEVSEGSRVLLLPSLLIMKLSMMEILRSDLMSWSSGSY